MTRRNLAGLVGLAVLLLAAAAPAEGLDDSNSLTCTLNSSSQCDAEAACIGVTLEQINLSGAFRVDFAGAKLASLNDERTSPIDDVDVLPEVLVVQGHQDDRGWTLVIDRTTGHLSATLAEREGAFVLAGECQTD